MATFRKASAAQYPLFIEQVINFDDTVTDVDTSVASSLVSTAIAINFNLTNALPYGASIVGGDAVVETVWDGVGTGTAVLSLGDTASATRYLSSLTLEALGRTALTITGFKYSTATPLMATVTIAAGQAVPTTGKVRVRIEYIVENRNNENV